jgi:hypothetical protein
MAKPADTESSLAPFRDRAFAVLWVATVVSNIGTWMQGAAAGWLMTGLNPDAFVVSLIQVAASLPMFPFALPAGALADIIDRRRLLIAIQVAVTVLVAAFGILVWRSWATQDILLVFTFLSTAAAAIIMPAWQAIVPQLVPRQNQVRRCPQQYRPQCQSRDRAGACWRHHCGLGNGRAVLDKCDDYARRHRGPHLVHPSGGTGPLRQQCPTGRRCVISGDTPIGWEQTVRRRPSRHAPCGCAGVTTTALCTVMITRGRGRAGCPSRT